MGSVKDYFSSLGKGVASLIKGLEVTSGTRGKRLISDRKERHIFGTLTAHTLIRHIEHVDTVDY